MNGDNPHIRVELKAHQDTTGNDFVHEVAYGSYRRSFALSEGVDAAEVKAGARQRNTEVNVPAPRAARPRMIKSPLTHRGRGAEAVPVMTGTRLACRYSDLPVAGSETDLRYKS